MENKDANLIRKMISLVEQADEKAKNKLIESENISVDGTENPQDVDEQITKVAAADAKLLANTLKAEPALFQTLKTEIPALAKFKSSDDLITALNAEAGTVGALNLADKFAILKQVQKVPEVAVKIKGFLSDAKAVQEMGKLAFPKGTVMPADPAKLKIARETLMKSYNLPAQQADDILRAAAQKASGETKVVSQFKGKKGGDPSLNPNAGKTPPTPGKTPPTPGKVQAPGPGGQKLIDRWNKAKETVKGYKDDVLKKIQSLKGRLSPKQLALYGLAGYGAYELLFGDKGDEKGQDQVLGNCVANLPGVTFGIGTGDVAIAKIPDGVDEKSKGKGGLTFWPNGRVISGDLSVRGNYYCKGGEIKSAIAENQINEVDYNGVHIDWDGDKKTNPVPNPNPNPKPKYTPCTSFPMKFGCKSDKIREVQSCLEMPQEKQTGNFGPLTQKALTAKGYSGTELSEPDYLKILQNCGKTTEPSRVNRLNAEPIKIAPRDIKTVPTDLSKLTIQDLSSRIKPIESTPEQLYNSLKNAGLIFGEDGNNRIKYKGPTPDGVILDKLDLALQNMGYTRIKTLEDMKRYGSKYVWLKTQ